ncbi:hypothetical protein Tco_1342333 [Tanacetum coccineum]
MKLTDLMVLCIKLQTQVLDLQKAKDAQAKEIDALKKRIQRLERRKISRPTGLKRLRKVGMSRSVESSTDQESLDETQKRQDEDLMFDLLEFLEDEEMHVEANLMGKNNKSSTRDTISSSKDKGKGIMIEPEVPLKRKDQISLDEQIARDIQAKLDAELLEEQKLARKQEEEANIALIEKRELTDEEKAKLFMELMEKRRKHFAALRAQEKRNRPPTKAQKRTQMSTYLKHMESKEKKEEGREETTKGSRKKMLGRKRAGKEQQKESSKKQKVEEEKESEEVDEVDEAELKKLLVIKKDEDIAIDAIPLATKLLVIIDYKIHKEGIDKKFRKLFGRIDEANKQGDYLAELIDSSGVHFIRYGVFERAWRRLNHEWPKCNIYVACSFLNIDGSLEQVVSSMVGSYGSYNVEWVVYFLRYDERPYERISLDTLRIGSNIKEQSGMDTFILED